MKGSDVRVCILYAAGHGVSGQIEATRLLSRELKSEGWRCREVVLPVFASYGHRRCRGALLFLWKLLISWISALFEMRTGQSIYINLGQSWISLLRGGIPFILLSIAARRHSRCIALHGSSFMRWRPSDPITRVFRFIALFSNHVVVLGPRQKSLLKDLGVPCAKIHIIPNAVDIGPISINDLSNKHRNATTVKCLYLSTLIPEKGYPEFLEALLLISKKAIPVSSKIEATICGPHVRHVSGGRFRDQVDAATWVQNIVSEINRNDNVYVRIINGAFGDEKRRLYEDAHVFLLPSYYAVEAQPLTILEAFALGCAVITSTIGEIPFTVGNSAIMLPEVSAESVAKAIVELVNKPEVRLKMALSGFDRFNRLYTVEQHVNSWTRILRGSQDNDVS